MKEKFNFIYDIVKSNIEKLDKNEIGVDQAKAIASLAKQMNNVLVSQIEAYKLFNIKKTNDTVL